jgi:hypothetical protein
MRAFVKPRAVTIRAVPLRRRSHVFTLRAIGDAAASKERVSL